MTTTEKRTPRRTVSIQGVITLTAHAHQTAPDGGAEGVTPQLKTTVFANGQCVHDVPYITANSVRGLLRRAAGGVLLEQMEAKGWQIPRNVYLSVMRGSYSRTGVEAGGATYMQLVKAHESLFAGIFGGGAYMYAAAMRQHRDLLPIIEPIASIFPDRYRAQALNASVRDILQTALIASRDDFQRLPARDVVENVEQAYTEHMTSKLSANAAKKTQKADAKSEGVFLNDADKIRTSDLNTFNTIEVIAIGVPLYFGLTLHDVTDAQIGLVLKAVQQWANDNALGGGCVRGRGSFKAALQLFEGEKTLAENLLIGDAPSYKLSDQVQPFVDAMLATLLDASTPANLSAIYPTVLTKDEKAAKKAKGKAATAEAA